MAINYKLVACGESIWVSGAGYPNLPKTEAVSDGLWNDAYEQQVEKK